MMISGILSFISFLVFLYFQAQGIYGGDSGDLVTAAFTGGIAHPPGYPLYSFTGWLLGHIPIFTPAWRIGLISSIAHAFVIGMVYWLVVHLTKNKFAGFFAALVLVGNYLFFLYSVTAEVFALLDFFIIFLLLLSIVYQQTRKERYALFGALVFGLALSHHHLILFLVPSLVCLLWGEGTKKTSVEKAHVWVVRLSVFFLGLLPYVYVFFAANGTSIINWNHATTIFSFIRLVTRSDYGTFHSGASFGQHIVERLINVRAYGRFLVLDFTWIGVLLGFLGSVWMYRKYKLVFISLLLGFILLGPGFFFYASFPLLNRFTLGTYERFLLPTYVIMSLFIGCGVYELVCCWESLIIRKLTVFSWFARFGFYCIILLYPLSIMSINIERFQGLSTDKTADNLGKDILATVPQESILLLSHDTPLFITQYVRYALGERPDVILLHQSIMESDYYPSVVSKAYPWVTLPNVGVGNFLKDFALAHVGHEPIFTNNPFTVDERWVWVPKGLLYELVSASAAPPIDVTLQENIRLWAMYHNPSVGILSRFDHLMLSDVRDIYESSKIALGKTLLRADRTEEAAGQFKEAVALKSDLQMRDAYTYLGLSELFLKHCDSAIAAFGLAKKASYVPDAILKLYESVTYRDCLDNPTKAKELFDAYTTAQSQKETPIEQ